MREDMSPDLAIGLILSLGAAAYLAYAMLRPERF